MKRFIFLNSCGVVRLVIDLDLGIATRPLLTLVRKAECLLQGHPALAQA